ncbi:geranylgeranyl diphosphate synthase type II [Gracilibacillus halotolerans]|uniref:Farnesyl diphosphate synthase n=1 Tax=Gracilibacillus halotolerans TaxID=74386 RepID=A0A841RM01_9BACI|nr:geranylgeranyl diphosphate synthase type II [Gracilibacillus halotolerans]
MNKEFTNWLDQEKEKFMVEMNATLDKLHIPSMLRESVYYSINAGGKRLRPILMGAACEAFGGKLNKVYPAAIALEMIHTYSLIHDDLPAMDNDMYRRGMPTNHIKFGEATAILAGDGLLTNSFQMISSSDIYTADQKVFLLDQLSKASGLEGMVAGQHLDMIAETKPVDIANLEKIHQLKTGKLLTYAVTAGAYLADVTMEELSLIQSFGNEIGLIFQIQDDILDVIGDQQIMGKQVGSDKGNEKSTYPSLLGLDGAIEKRDSHYKIALSYLEELQLTNSMLAQLTTYLVQRNK